MPPNVTYHLKDDALAQTARALVADGKGLLAADESLGSIKKRFEKYGIESTEETRRHYREVLLSTPGPLDEYLSGVILFTEQLTQSDTKGTPFPKLLASRVPPHAHSHQHQHQHQHAQSHPHSHQHPGILTGGKTDLGTKPFPPDLFPSPNDHGPPYPNENETYTTGLEGLKERSEKCFAEGARFAKWRATYEISEDGKVPSDEGLKFNANILAQYASISQSSGLVPIIEPEILTTGSHSLQRSLQVHIQVLGSVFEALRRYDVRLDATILKTSMVTPGDDYDYDSEDANAKSGGGVSLEDIANATLTALSTTVPPAIPGIVFLSGGQPSLRAVQTLDAINKAANKSRAYHSHSHPTHSHPTHSHPNSTHSHSHSIDPNPTHTNVPNVVGGYNPYPWKLTFSFGRALQDDALELWSEGWKLKYGGKEKEGAGTSSGGKDEKDGGARDEGAKDEGGKEGGKEEAKDKFREAQKVFMEWARKCRDAAKGEYEG